jgi:hypothetical protein
MFCGMATSRADFTLKMFAALGLASTYTAPNRGTLDTGIKFSKLMLNDRWENGIDPRALGTRMRMPDLQARPQSPLQC